MAANVLYTFNFKTMSCEICGRRACTRSFSFIRGTRHFDNIADDVKERVKRIITNKVNRLTGDYDENDVYWVRLEDVISVIDDYS